MDLGTEQVVICNNLQQEEVICDLMAFGGDKDSSEVLIGSEKVDVDSKGKTKICYDDTWPNQVKDGAASDPGKSSTPESIISNNINSSNSDMSFHDDDDDNCEDYADDVSDYDDNDDYLYEDDYINMQSQFDNVDLPPGVEASLPWLDLASASSTSTISDLSESKRKATIPDLNENKRKATVSSSSSTIPAESSPNGKEEKEKTGVTPEKNEESGVMPNSQQFKQFDIVDDFSDHHYSGFLRKELPPKEWAKKIQDEWKILESHLPGTIFVRVCEARMELLRAVMIGPSGTPYHDGLFVFDCLFPANYPNEPPMVYYYSGGLRLNPNLYECGKVCLSLLGTWSGKATEMWNKKNSTMLQVLVSIQGLILNAKPFFNEPGYEKSYVGPEGERMSRSYNEDAFILSLKTMMYTLRKPPKHFEDLVADHFRKHAHDILVTCKAYMEGAVVGFVVVKDGVPDVDKVEGGSSNDFKTKLGQMMNVLITNFTKNGSTDCEQFRNSPRRP